jgi:RNA polymerase sigma factor (sigma-70 family)
MKVVGAVPLADQSDRSGMTQAWVVTDLQERRGKALWGLARRLDLDDEEAADLVQEALLRLWRELSTGADIVDPDAWAFRVIYRLAMDQHRLRRSVRGLIDQFASAAAHQAPRDPTDALAVWAEVDRLPARQRAVLYLHYRADLPYEAVGSILGITANGARNHASAGLVRLRGAFALADGEQRWT